jgi:hypothetical protein
VVLGMTPPVFRGFTSASVASISPPTVAIYPTPILL